MLEIIAIIYCCIGATLASVAALTNKDEFELLGSKRTTAAFIIAVLCFWPIMILMDLSLKDETE